MFNAEQASRGKSESDATVALALQNGMIKVTWTEGDCREFLIDFGNTPLPIKSDQVYLLQALLTYAISIDCEGLQ